MQFLRGTMEKGPIADHVTGLDLEDAGNQTETVNQKCGKRKIKWEDHEQAHYLVGLIGAAKFEINSGVGGMFSAMFSFAGDCYAVLSTAQTIGEAKRFCEWVARGYGLDTE